MNILITGASSGIGRDMAEIMCEKGHMVYVVARREGRLIELKNKYPKNIIPIVCDISEKENCFNLFEELKDKDIDILINNAGYGMFGKFNSTDLNRELKMIDTNIIGLHILTKLFYKQFTEKNKGYILNVASSAGFMMGPLLSSYYASKAYVLRLSEALYREAMEMKSNVVVSVLCPGPVKTEFDNVADVKFSISGLESKFVAKYALNKMFKGKMVIIPGISIKLLVFFSRFIPDRLLSKITYNIQRKKENA
jgi:short-subunit dehydrogenase